MGNLIIPQKITIHLIDYHGQLCALGNVLFTIHLFARRKNDFHLGPYLSDKDGIVTITEGDLRHDIDATYDSGLMDYTSVEDCHALVEIQPNTVDDIKRAIHSRETVWTNLLKGEKERWGSMQNLLKTYRESSNHRLVLPAVFPRIRDEWDGIKPEYEYDFRINISK
jgi:hypothetical protein